MLNFRENSLIFKNLYFTDGYFDVSMNCNAWGLVPHEKYHYLNLREREVKELRRNWKNVLSVVLAASMVFTMNTVAFAGTTSDNATAIETEATEIATEAATEVAEASEEASETATEATEVAEATEATEATEAAETDETSSVASAEEYDVEIASVSPSVNSSLSSNAFKFLRKFKQTTVSGTKVSSNYVDYVFGTTYVPGKAILSANAIEGVTDGSKQLYVIYEYYDSNPWYDSRTRAWDGSYYNPAKGKYTKAKTGTASSSKSVAVDAALVWYDETAHTYSMVDGVRLKKVTIKNAKNASKDISGNELTSNPKYKNSFLRLTFNINKNTSNLTKAQIKTINNYLSKNSDTKFDFGILKRSLSANWLQGSYGTYSSLKIKASSFTIKNILMNIRFLNAESGEDGEASNTYQTKTIKIALPKKTGSTGASIAGRNVKYGAYCEEFSKTTGTVVLKGVNNFDGEIVLTTSSPYGTFTIEQ